MARDVRGNTPACWDEKHNDCPSPDSCYCECHLPAEDRSVSFRLRELTKSTLPDSQRLQVLIQLTAELAEGIR